MNAINFVELVDVFKDLKSIKVSDTINAYLMNPRKSDRLGLSADNDNHYYIDVVYTYHTGDVKVKCDQEVNNGILHIFKGMSIEMPIWPNINKIKSINIIKGK